MSKATELIDDINTIKEGKQYRTRVKEVESNQGTRHIRNMVEQAQKRIVNMLNPKHGSPNPKEKSDQLELDHCHNMLQEIANKLKHVGETRRKIK